MLFLSIPMLYLNIKILPFGFHIILNKISFEWCGFGFVFYISHLRDILSHILKILIWGYFVCMYKNSLIHFNLLHDHKCFAIFSTYFLLWLLYTEKLSYQQNKMSFYLDTIFWLVFILYHINIKRYVCQNRKSCFA